MGTTDGSRSSGATRVRQSVLQRMKRRATVRGEITLPAVPHMLDEYVAMCDETFMAAGCEFTPDQRARLAEIMLEQLEAAFSASPRSEIVVSYESPIGTALNYWIKPQHLSVEETYDNWLSNREPPLFGTHPDARVWALAAESSEPWNFPVLDIGAGTGRNSLALARRGHPVDAVEMTPKFAEAIRIGARRESLTVRVVEGDVFTAADDLLDDYKLVLLSEVVSDFRTTEQLRGVFELAARCLAPGGHLVFNAFLADDDFTVDAAIREAGQQTYTSVFTRDEVQAASASLPFELVSDDSVHDYEQRHLPPDAWPPTSWYVEWVTGLDLFDVSREESPVDMRWLVYRRV